MATDVSIKSDHRSNLYVTFLSDNVNFLRHRAGHNKWEAVKILSEDHEALGADPHCYVVQYPETLETILLVCWKRPPSSLIMRASEDSGLSWDDGRTFEWRFLDPLPQAIRTKDGVLQRLAVNTSKTSQDEKTFKVALTLHDSLVSRFEI